MTVVSLGARVLELSQAHASHLHSALHGDPAGAEACVRDLASDPVRLSAEVVSVKAVASDAGVSYGHTYRTPSDTTLLLVAIGYGHGVPRKAGNRAEVTWRDREGTAHRMPIVGRVAMDVLVVDAGQQPVQSGDRVVLFGVPATGEISLTEWAASVGEHPVAVIAGLDDRVSREVRA
ncbi:alanine racemase C-terminal domain-containing protein [Salinibacterium sp. ZJ454]|uniref:alanine racemase C-terminal domain-containing protein n=1 Tax=Salinibacterium sp. ZJ454 TaxID=2708339 RepID=UPI001AB05370|nr:alanine racemase C-terminal domain-containing protein [Salinibacterium sp. ZJ454]